MGEVRMLAAGFPGAEVARILRCMDAFGTPRLERRSRLLASHVSPVERAILLLDIATDPDEPPLTEREAVAVAGELLRFAAGEELDARALEVNEPLREDLTDAARELMALHEAASPEAHRHFMTLEAIGRAVGRIGRR